MRWKQLFILSLFLLTLNFQLVAEDSTQTFYFTPPKGWERIDDPSQLPQKVKLIYIGNGKGQFSPSINLACEETTVPIEEYVTLAKSYHESSGDTRCSCLGTLDTRVGTAYLLQIDRPTQWGNVRFIQGVVIKAETAYVITATCLHEEFGSLAPQFFKAIQSFTLH